MQKILKLLVICSFFTSCLGSKSVSEKTTSTNTTSKEESTRDSVSATLINQAIKDAIRMHVPAQQTNNIDFDKAVNDAVDEVLSKLNNSKQSGNNGYNINYDKIKREILLELNVGETKSTETGVTTTSKIEKTFEQQSDEYFSKKISMIPWWIYAVAVFYFLPNIVSSLTLIISPIKNILKKSS